MRTIFEPKSSATHHYTSLNNNAIVSYQSRSYCSVGESYAALTGPGRLGRTIALIGLIVCSILLLGLLFAIQAYRNLTTHYMEELKNNSETCIHFIPTNKAQELLGLTNKDKGDSSNLSKDLRAQLKQAQLELSQNQSDWQLYEQTRPFRTNAAGQRIYFDNALDLLQEWTIFSTGCSKILLKIPTESVQGSERDERLTQAIAEAAALRKIYSYTTYQVESKGVFSERNIHSNQTIAKMTNEFEKTLDSMAQTVQKLYIDQNKKLPLSLLNPKNDDLDDIVRAIIEKLNLANYNPLQPTPASKHPYRIVSNKIIEFDMSREGVLFYQNIDKLKDVLVGSTIEDLPWESILATLSSNEIQICNEYHVDEASMSWDNTYDVKRMQEVYLDLIEACASKLREQFIDNKQPQPEAFNNPAYQFVSEQIKLILKLIYQNRV